MRAHNLVFSMVILSGLGALAACGVSSRGVLPRLDGGTGDMSGSCRTEGFACVKSADCCPGLTCTNTVCTNPGGGGGDLASKPRDMAMGGGGALVCGALLSCVNDCADEQCFQACAQASTAKARQLFGAVLTCLFGDSMTGARGACNDFNGGVCDGMAPNYNKAACDACLSKAQSQGGACYNTLLTCLADCAIDDDCAQLTCGGAACTCIGGVCG